MSTSAPSSPLVDSVIIAGALSQFAVDEQRVPEHCRFCEPGQPCRFHRKPDPEPVPGWRWKRRNHVPLATLDAAEIANGFRIIRPRRPIRKCPDWASNPWLLKVILLSHPQAKKLFRKWYWIAYWYFRMNLSAREIADELGQTTKAVERIIEQIRKRAARLLTGFHRSQYEVGALGKLRRGLEQQIRSENERTLVQ